MDSEFQEIFPQHVTFTNIGCGGPEAEEEFRRKLLKYLEANSSTTKTFSHVPVTDMKMAMLGAITKACTQHPLCCGGDVTCMPKKF